jgi:hypothetical protein
MRVYRLAMYFAVIGLATSLGYSTSQASVAIVGLRSWTECPPWCEDRAEPPHYRPVHGRRSGLQVRVVL